LAVKVGTLFVANWKAYINVGLCFRTPPPLYIYLQSLSDFIYITLWVVVFLAQALGDSEG
jgi:hypothetical protein